MYEQLDTSQIASLLVRFSIESLLLALFLWLAWFRLGLRNACRRLGPWQTRVIFGFVALMTLAQVLDRWQYHFPSRISCYPLARFAMYQTGQPREYVRSYRFQGLFGDEIREINITREFPAIGLPPTNTRFRVISRDLISDDQQKQAWAKRQITGFCRGIVDLRRERNLEVPSTIWFVVDRWDRESQTRQEIKRFEVPGHAT